jgi:hypothetical protein
MWDRNVIVWGGASDTGGRNTYDDGEILILP